MVSKLLVLALLASGMVDAASFNARLDKPAITLGEPVSLSLEARGLSLDELDITPLTSRFDVAARTLSRGTDSETLVLTLYPRAAGVLSVPPLHVDSLRTAALALSVADGSETVPRVTATWSLTPASPLVNQPTRLTLSICDDGSLQWQRPDLPTFTGRLLRPLGEEEGEGRRGEEACTLHQFHWALIATQSGPASLGVSMIEANRFGRRLRFPGPVVDFQARVLPAWLPGATPPVAPRVQAEALPSRWPVNRPLRWRFQVTGGYSVEGLKTLLDLQLRETPELGLYPPLIEEIGMEDRASPLSRYAVTLYFQPRTRGELTLPMLRLPWYDATRGQLASIELQARPLTVFDPLWKRLAFVTGGVAGVLLLGGAIWQGRRMMRWRLARRQGLQNISRARSVDALAHAVRQFSLSGQPAAPSLGEWMQRMQLTARGGDIESAVLQLEQLQFGRGAYALPELRQTFLRALAHIRPESLA